MLAFRAAREPDIDRLVDIHTVAFPDPRAAAERVRNFVGNPLGILDDLQVAELHGAIVAHAFLFPLAAYFGGARVPVGGIASVGVAPEARGRGVARALVEHLHDLAHARGDAVTLLYPFRQAFYESLGYASTTPTKRLAFAPGAIPKRFRDRADAEAFRLRAAAGEDRATIEALHAKCAESQTGVLDRPRALWDARFANERRQWILAARAGAGASGYVSFEVTQPESHAATRALVHEIVAGDAETRRALLGMLSSLRDQVVEIDLDLDAFDPLDRVLVDADRARFGTEAVEHPFGITIAGPMVRLLDAERGLLARGYLRDGAIDLALEGRVELLRLRVEAGEPRLAVDASSAPALALDSKTLAAILYGALLPSHAAALGCVRGTASALAAADALFALPPYFSVDPF